MVFTILFAVQNSATVIGPLSFASLSLKSAQNLRLSDQLSSARENTNHEARLNIAFKRDGKDSNFTLNRTINHREIQARRLIPLGRSSASRHQP